jgi:hypothetical protein
MPRPAPNATATTPGGPAKCLVAAAPTGPTAFPRSGPGDPSAGSPGPVMGSAGCQFGEPGANHWQGGDGGTDVVDRSHVHDPRGAAPARDLATALLGVGEDDVPVTVCVVEPGWCLPYRPYWCWPPIMRVRNWVARRQGVLLRFGDVAPVRVGPGPMMSRRCHGHRPVTPGRMTGPTVSTVSGS